MNIIDIPPGTFSCKTQLMPDHKLNIEHQMRLNRSMKEVDKKEITKWLDVGVIRPMQKIVGYALFSLCLKRWNYCVP